MRKISPILTVATLAFVNFALAAPISNWKELNAGSTNSGMNTNSPTIGDGTADDASDAWVAGRFGTVATPASVTLAVGETLTVSGSVVMTGGTNAANNFRVGVFDESGQFASGGTTWANGGWIFRAGDNGLYQARTNNVFVSTNPNAVDIPDTVSNTGGGFTADSTAAYNWSLSVTRATATTADPFGSLTGGDNSFSETYSINGVDATASGANSTFSFNAVGLLFGGTMQTDQAELSNVQYTVVPESSAALLIGLGGLALLRRRKS